MLKINRLPGKSYTMGEYKAYHYFIEFKSVHEHIPCDNRKIHKNIGVSYKGMISNMHY